MVESYLKHRNTLKAVVHIIDSRHTPTPEDIQLRNWLTLYHIPIITVLTKTDKLSKNKQLKSRQEASRLLGIKPDNIILFSATKKTGRDELLKTIMEFIEADET